MRFIEELRNTHTGDIWVVGAGPSLDDYPVNFFDDKVCVGVNWVFYAFLDVGDKVEKFRSRTFYSVHAHREEADWLVKNKPDFLKHCFFLLPPSRIDAPHRRLVWWEDYNEDPYYMRWGQAGSRGIEACEEDFESTARCVMESKGACYYVSKGTTLHWAIQAAAVLGARKIYIVGGESRCTENKHHAQERGLSIFAYNIIPGRKYSTEVFAPKHLQGAKMLAKAFKPYGVEIVQYYYKTGEVKLV